MASKRKRVFEPRSKDKGPVQQAVPRGGLLDQLQLMQAGLLAPRQGQFLDLTGFDDYQSALDFVVETKQRFQALPSGLRRDCQNDPRQFLRMASNAAQGDEVAAAQFRRYGLSVTPAGDVAGVRPGSPTPPKVVQTDLVKEAEK